MKKSLSRSKLIFILLLSLILTCCRSVSETVKSESSEQSRVKGTTTVASSSELQTTGVETRLSDVKSQDSTSSQVIHVVLSAPDGLGRQFPVSITYTSSDNKKIVQASQDSKSTIESQGSVKEKTHAVFDEKSKKSTASKLSESKKPPNIQLFVLLIVAVSIYIAYRKIPWVNILKRIQKLFKYK